MKTFWRISNYRDLSGEGGRIASARWHTEGRPVVYLAETPAGAMLERIVHLGDREGNFPRVYQLLEVEAEEGLVVSTIDPSGDPRWKVDVAITRALGDAWLAGGEAAVARVPSVIIAHTWNCLFNPVHPDAGRIRIVSATRERFDPRLFDLG